MIRRSNHNSGASLADSAYPCTITRPHPSTLQVPADFPPPPSFGLPDTFPIWRPGQFDAITRIIDSTKRFIVICAPTGMGKSLLGIAAGVIPNHRSITLTSTLGLADQYLRSFSAVAQNIRGMGNYKCSISASVGLSPNTSVADGSCNMGY